MKCSTCKYRWCGSFTPKLNRALWHCRKPELDAHPRIIGNGSDKALKEAKGCGEWKKMNDYKRYFILAHDTARRLAAAQCLIAPDGYVVEIKPPTRTLAENAKLHAILADIAAQVIWMGQKLPLEVWKRLCMAAWLRECGEQPMLIPAIDGNGFDVIFERPPSSPSSNPPR